MKKQKLQEGSTSSLPEVIKQQPSAKKIKLKPLKYVTKVKTTVKKIT